MWLVHDAEFANEGLGDHDLRKELTLGARRFGAFIQLYPPPAGDRHEKLTWTDMRR